MIMDSNRRRQCTVIWMHSALVLAGMGTVLLGPILPLLAKRWQLDDSGSGLLLLAQFFGAFLGGVTVASRPRRELIIGILAAIAGLTGFAEVSGKWSACVAIAIAGFGVGRLITSANLVAAWQFADDRRSVLTRLSFSWGIGAMLSPVLYAALTPRHGLRTLWIALAALFVILLAAVLADVVQLPAHAPSRPHTERNVGLPLALLVLFATGFALYGGLESSSSGWMTTFALRFGGFRIVTSEYTSFLLLAGLTAGRFFAAYLPAKRGDRAILRVALASSTLCICLLGFAHTRLMMSVFATLLGLSLAAIFPTLFSLLMEQQPQPRQAGLVNALAGLGGAIVPWLVGIVSRQTGSLKLALIIPLLSAVTLLWMTFAKR